MCIFSTDKLLSKIHFLGMMKRNVKTQRLLTGGTQVLWFGEAQECHAIEKHLDTLI